MARNAEKAQSMLFRFHASQAAESGIIDLGRTRRPRAITTVTDPQVAEKWRSQVLKEISRKVTKIQDPALSDFQLRDLNDELNKLMREKHVWERQIRALGGPNFTRGGGAVVDEMGREVPGGGRGYRYFGRARELPGVKEMFENAVAREREEREAKEGGRNEMKGVVVDAGYFGWNRDEEGGKLLAYEAGREKRAREELLRGVGTEEEEENEEWVELPGDVGDGRGWAVPSAEEVEEELLERKKRRMLDRLGS